MEVINLDNIIRDRRQSPQEWSVELIIMQFQQVSNSPTRQHISTTNIQRQINPTTRHYHQHEQPSRKNWRRRSFLNPMLRPNLQIPLHSRRILISININDLKPLHPNNMHAMIPIITSIGSNISCRPPNNNHCVPRPAFDPDILHLLFYISIFIEKVLVRRY